MSLIGEKRKQKILELLHTRGSVKTAELVETLSVSSETIRRYLEELENRNKLRRVYGGAVQLNFGREEPSHFRREVLHAEAKKRIGQAAARLVRDHDVIALDDGTTTLQIIPHLHSKRDLVVITASVPHLSSLIHQQNRGDFSGEIYFLGGRVHSKHFRVTGLLTERMMENFYADKAFISVDGILIDRGITSYETERALLTQRFIARAGQNIVVSDRSKLGVGNFFKIADVQDVDSIICDAPAPESWLEKLQSMETEWIQAE